MAILKTHTDRLVGSYRDIISKVVIMKTRIPQYQYLLEVK